MEFLPTKERLAFNIVTLDNLLQYGSESVMHALVTCPFTSSIWQGFRLNNPWDRTIGFAAWRSSMLQGECEES